MSEAPEQQWLTVSDIVARTGIPVDRVREYLRDPGNPAHIPNHSYPIRGGKAMRHRVRLEDFEQWWESRRI